MRSATPPCTVLADPTRAGAQKLSTAARRYFEPDSPATEVRVTRSTNLYIQSVVVEMFPIRFVVGELS